MTVKELIERLSQIDNQEMEVVYQNMDAYFTFYKVDYVEIKQVSSTPDPIKYQLEDNKDEAFRVVAII